MKKNQINKKMSIGEALGINENTGEILSDSGLYCMGCSISNFETIEEGCLIHGMSEKQIDSIINEINQSKHKEN